MKFKLLQQISVMAKYTLIGVYLQCLFVGLLLATDIAAQKKSIEEVVISLDLNKTNLEEAFLVIGEKTNFNFQYDTKTTSKKTLNGTFNEVSLADLLRFISNKTSLSFKRINETIHVSKNRGQQASVTEEIGNAGLLVDKPVSGTILDENGETLPGANVLIKGTSTGAVTNLDGKYQLEVPDEATLVFSSVGYISQEILVGNQSVIDVTMVPDVKSLDEIVVVGYGVQEGRKVSSSVSQISTEDLEVKRRPITNIQSALIGSTAGLIITQAGGNFNDAMNIRVRETSGISDANANALVLIDGFEGSLNNLAPNSIESISVLKDAAATAIYGARGANGVVLVTTTSAGRNQPLRLTYGLHRSVQNPAQTADLLNSEEFMKFTNEAETSEQLRNGADLADIIPSWSDADIQRAASGFYPETKWVEELYSEQAVQTSHNIGISGGTENTGYLLNLEFLKQNGLAVGPDDQTRYNLRLKLDTDITDWMTIGTNLSVTNRSLNNVPVTEGNAVRGRPFFPVQLEDGTYVDKGAAGGEPNPIGLANSGSYDKRKIDGYNVQLFAQIKPIDGLVIEERISFNKSTNFREIWNTSYPFAVLDTDLTQVGDVIQPQAGDRNFEIRSGYDKTINTLSTARYKRSFEQHNLNALIGFQTTEETSNEVRAGRQGFILGNLQDLTLGLANSNISGDPLGNTSFAGTPRTTVSYFGRLGYDFKGKYLAELNFRADASSNFGPNNKWGYFPALSVGWNLIEEDFMNSAEFVDILKLRASWGKTGDDGSINVIETANYAPSGVAIGDVALPTIVLGTAINPNLKWETSQKTNIGLELTLWQGKLGFVGEYFIDNRSDIIRPVPTALETGLGRVLDNSFDAKTWGWEFDLSHKNNIGSVNYFANFNFSLYDSEITDLKDTGPFIDDEAYQAVGLPIRGNWFGYETDGFFDNQEEMDANNDRDGNPIDQSAVSTQGDSYGRYLGGFKYVDQITDIDDDGDGVIDRQGRDGVITTDDRIVIKENTGDNKRIGFSLGASYKGFTLSARFYGVLQGYEWYRGGVLRPFTGDIAPYAYQTDTWTVDNMDASYPQATASNVTPFSDRASHLIKDNAYIKMKNINLGYSFNQDFIDKLKVITGLDVYLSIENIGTIWTNSFAHEYGWDPELGLGNFDYPIPLTTSLGLNVKF